MTGDEEEEITMGDLYDYRFVGDPLARKRREKLGKLLRIGYTNGKQLHKRLRMFQISKEEFVKAAERIDQEEQKNE